jgi:hypothetical protein
MVSDTKNVKQRTFLKQILYHYSLFIQIPFTIFVRCKCGNCSTELLQNSKEAQCCMEIDGCVEAINSDQVLSEVDSPPSCVTFHPGFNPVCLETWSLRQAGRKYQKTDGTKYHKSDSENRLGFIYHYVGVI